MSSFRLRIANARQIVQVCAHGELFKAGAAQQELAVLENASLVIDQSGRIASVGSADQVDAWLSQQPQPVTFEKDVDGRDFVVLPGFVDAHTHPVWSGNRVNEFAMKLAGATYMEVHESGGGINNTVRATKKSSEAELSTLLHKRLDRMLRSGTTLIEAKSGYGLETDTEIKMLRVLHAASTGDDAHPVEIVSNYLGGHSVPDGMSAAAATDDIVNKQIPAVVQAIKDGTISPEFIDVFCEKGVFEHEDSHRILEAGKEAGLQINFHGDEMHPMRSGTIAAALGARAISHCEMLTADDIQVMAANKPDPVFAVLLPTTMFILKLPSPPARDMIAAGVPVALGSDYNPNAHCLSMALTMNMACVQFGMTMKEALVGATINAAASINRSATHGSLEVGKQGDLVLMRGSQWEQIIYEMGDPPIEHVVKKGVFYPTK
ncbi:putative imidazolonepropionase [Phytophthora boehmeriae]|uniref:Probable imidazolonepropionase n=1 Tax=Phytophthora boehmeriae TaxID=109152 RepID=A0A8T1W878_9STRA|nr:putative imidazolonepropionase [Phytophthora boehmeriae]